MVIFYKIVTKYFIIGRFNFGYFESIFVYFSSSCSYNVYIVPL